MTDLAAAASSAYEPRRAGERELRRALRALCLTEIVSWGVLYYAFTVLATRIRDDTHWSITTLTAVFSGALVISGVAGVVAGRLIHTHGPRWVMTGGSVLASGALVVIATAHHLVVYAIGWALAGVAMAGVLYAPAFAAVTVWFGAARVRALTAITLVAGLASTVFAPLSALLVHHMSWRASYLVLAAVLAALTIAPHALALRLPWPNAEDVPDAATASAAALTDQPDTVAEVDKAWFWRITLAYTAMALCSYAVLINLVPLLHDRGYSDTAAAWALGIGGAGQVLGRLAYAPFARRTTLVARTVLVFGAIAVTTALFAVISTPYALLVVVSLVAGNARGLATLLGATAVSDRWGIARYAKLNGIFNAPTMAAAAFAPFIGAGLAALLGGYPAAFAVLAVVGAIGIAGVLRP